MQSYACPGGQEEEDLELQPEWEIDRRELKLLQVVRPRTYPSHAAEAALNCLAGSSQVRCGWWQRTGACTASSNARRCPVSTGHQPWRARAAIDEGLWQSQTTSLWQRVSLTGPTQPEVRPGRHVHAGGTRRVWDCALRLLAGSHRGHQGAQGQHSCGCGRLQVCCYAGPSQSSKPAAPTTGHAHIQHGIHACQL